VLVLSRQYVQCVFEGLYCGRDARKTGERYRDGGYLRIETTRRIDQAVERLPV
jgi:hypothetical protein